MALSSHSMNVTRSAQFDRDLAKLRNEALKGLVEKTIGLLEAGEDRPSMHKKRIVCKRADNLFSVRISKGFRLLYIDYGDEIELYRLLDHDKYDRLTKNC